MVVLGGGLFLVREVRGYLAYKKTHRLRTLPQAYAQGPRGVLGGWAFSYGRGTPVEKGLVFGESQLFSVSQAILKHLCSTFCYPMLEENTCFPE